MNCQQLDDLYSRFLGAYGPQDWWPGSHDPLEVTVGAILTQRCAWRNAAQAVEALKAADLLSIHALAAEPEESIQRAIRPAGFYRSKTATLRGLADHVIAHHSGELPRMLAQPMAPLRRELLSLRGIGEETADAVLLYAAGCPSFVIDAYARRLLVRLGWIEGDETYAELRSAFMTTIDRDVALYNEYHALIVRHGKERCRSTPRCAGCPLFDLCHFPTAGAEGNAA